MLSQFHAEYKGIGRVIGTAHSRLSDGGEGGMGVYHVRP